MRSHATHLGWTLFGLLSALPPLACSQADPESAATPARPEAQPPGKAEAEAEDDHDNLVQLEVLLAGEHELAIRYQIKPGWHLYWINPGDAGLKTDAEFEAPPGFTFEALRYPAPEAFTSPGDITSYGYQHEVVLFTTFSMSDPPPAQSLVKVKASWLACKSSCIRGQAETTIEVATAHAADDTLLIEHRQKLPRPSDEFAVTSQWTQADGGPVLRATIPSGKVIEFFPLRTDPAMLDATEVETNQIELHYQVPPERQAQLSGAQGVLVVEADDGVRSYFHLEAPWPNA